MSFAFMILAFILYKPGVALILFTMACGLLALPFIYREL